jgi:hypothetical protein
MTFTRDSLLWSSDVRYRYYESLQCPRVKKKFSFSLARKASGVVVSVSEVTDAEACKIHEKQIDLQHTRNY